MNGVPLRRVNQAYVIATSTKVDISDVKLPEINDAYFAKEKVSSKKTKEEQFFAQSASVRTPFHCSHPGPLLWVSWHAVPSVTVHSSRPSHLRCLPLVLSL